MLLALATQLAIAQAQPEILYTYDAAGNLIGVTRTTTANKPDLTVTNLSIGVITAVGDGSFRFPVTFDVNNVGGATAVASWYDRGYLSASTVLHDADQLLAGSATHSANLAAGSTYTANTTLTTSTTTVPGNYYLIVKADGGASTSGQFGPTGPNYVDESNEFNNTQAVAINLPANPRPDLTVSNASVGVITVNQNGSYRIPVSLRVNNIGSTTAPAGWYDVGYLSNDGVLDTSDPAVGWLYHNATLASGASYTVTLTATTATTTAPGSYTLFLKGDGHLGLPGYGGTPTDNGAVAEANEANNTQALSITLPVKPDLAVSSVSIGAITVKQNGAYTFPVTFTVTNNGGAAAQPGWYDAAYLSTDGTLDNSDSVMGYLYHNVVLASGASYTTTFAITTATTTAPGSYTLFVKGDGHLGLPGYGGTPTDNGAVAEANEANNTQALSIALPVKPDLSVSNLTVGAIVKNANGSYSIPITFLVNNVGGSAAAPNWFDVAYLSADAVLDNADQALATGRHVQTVALVAGGSYLVNTTFTTSITAAAGSYTLFVKADGRGVPGYGGTPTDSGSVAEASETNNVASISVVLP
ncbi:MAG TPA: hypothetical protein VMM27_10455 [Casimicrobiaceae bacterium]|nr:hypothetical protein [Casimicrobiaceae bacterium]